VLAGKGVTAWQRTLASLVPAARVSPASPLTPGDPAAPLPAGPAAELISVLAAVALAGTSPRPRNPLPLLKEARCSPIPRRPR
jgi:hypothetical protein